MKIQAITSYKAVQNNFSQKSETSNSIQNNNKEYKLPNYALSFGMAKIKHRGFIDKYYDENLDFDTKKDISKNMRKISNNTSIYGGKSNENHIARGRAVKDLVRKYAKDEVALKFIFACSDIDNTQAGREMAVSYLEGLKENASSEDWESGRYSEFLTEILCDTKNQTGKTIPQIFAQNADALKDIFGVTDYHNSVLYDVLTNRDDAGNTLADTIAQKSNRSSAKLLNKTVYHLAAIDKSIEKDRAIDLLNANEPILNDTNLNALYELLSENY